MDLQDYRKELDTLDSGLLELFCRRMEIAAKIGAYKKEKGLPVLDAARERESDADMAVYRKRCLGDRCGGHAAV